MKRFLLYSFVLAGIILVSRMTMGVFFSPPAVDRHSLPLKVAARMKAAAAVGLLPAATALRDVPSGARTDQRLSDLMAGIIRDNPRMAEIFQLATHVGPDRAAAILQVVNALGQRDVEATLRWITANVPEAAREAALQAVCRQLARREPDLAIYLAIALPASSTRDEILAFAAGRWTHEDSSAALAWLEHLAPDTARPGLVVTSVAFALADADPTAAIDFASQRLRTDDDQANALAGIAGIWVEHAPAAATAWVASLPENELRQGILKQMIFRWAQIDPGAARGWLDGLAPGISRDEGLWAYVVTVADKQPDVARDAVPLIANDDKRIFARQYIDRLTRSPGQ